jgi:hypothetical protein
MGRRRLRWRSEISVPTARPSREDETNEQALQQARQWGIIDRIPVDADAFMDETQAAARLAREWATTMQEDEDATDSDGFPAYLEVYPNAIRHYVEAKGLEISTAGAGQVADAARHFMSYWRSRGQFPRDSCGNPDWFTIYGQIHDHFRQWVNGKVARPGMAQARLFASLSALMSLVFLVCLPALVILLFVNWTIALLMIPIGIAAAVLAKWFNGLKLRAIYGREAGTMLNELDWASGRRLDL